MIAAVIAGAMLAVFAAVLAALAGAVTRPWCPPRPVRLVIAERLRPEMCAVPVARITGGRPYLYHRQDPRRPALRVPDGVVPAAVPVGYQGVSR